MLVRNLSIENQIEILKNKNLIINNISNAENILKHLSFFDIIELYKDLFVENDFFKENITIEKIFLFYHYDRSIQNILFKYSIYVERIFKNKMAQIIEDNIGITKEDYLNIEKYQTRNNNTEILENIFEEVRQIQASSEIPNILFKRVTFSTMTSLYNFLNEELKEKVIPFSFNNSEKTKAKELFRNSLFIIRKFRNEIAHTMDFVNYKSDRYVVFRYLKKSLNNIGYVKLTNKKDFVGNRRGSNDIFAMILVIILLLDYDFLREEMLKELANFIDNEDQEKFKDYAKITNLPKNLLERITKILNERMY